MIEQLKPQGSLELAFGRFQAISGDFPVVCSGDGVEDAGILGDDPGVFQQCVSKKQQHTQTITHLRTIHLF